MSEENLQNQNEIQQPGVEPISKTDAMVGIFTEPGNTFEAIGQTKQSYWVLPLVICVVLGLIAAIIGQLDPQLFGAMMDKQKKKMQEKFDEQVKEGKMTKEEAQQSMEQSTKFMDPNGTFFKIIAYAGSTIGVIVMFFIGSLLYFIGFKIFRSEAGFIEAMNVVALSTIISAIGGLLAIVLSVVMGHLVSVGPGLLVTEESVGEKMNKFLTALDIFAIWAHVVAAIGISKVGRISAGASYGFVFGLWIVWILISTFVF
jgi:hypothetical protein